jgi:2-dehydro-3-deoxyglucarate aldolase/4-hydroxy-2-oxoheptanedioate aldolase
MNGIAKLKKKLAKREQIFASMLCDVGHTSLPNLYSECGVELLILDLEHGSFFPENVGDFLQLCNMVDIPTIARIQDCEYHCISKCLDMGADGILIPRTESFEQVETAIASMRVHPRGKKGIGGRALIHKGEDVYDINENRLLFLQIESKQGIDLLDEILTKYGDEVAGIIIGPCDLSVSLGCGLKLFDAPEVMACIDETIAICKKHDKSIGMFMSEAEERWHDRGMNIFWAATEEILLIQALTRIKEQMDSFSK